MVEMIGRLLAIDYLAPRFPVLYYTFLIDSDPVEGALVKGSSGHSDITSGAGIFWDLCLRYDLKAHLSRFSSESNPGDAPSRTDFMFLQEAGAEWVFNITLIRPSCWACLRATFLLGLPSGHILVWLPLASACPLFMLSIRHSTFLLVELCSARLLI